MGDWRLEKSVPLFVVPFVGLQLVGWAGCRMREPEWALAVAEGHQEHLPCWRCAFTDLCQCLLGPTDLAPYPACRSMLQECRPFYFLFPAVASAALSGSTRLGTWFWVQLTLGCRKGGRRRVRPAVLQSRAAQYNPDTGTQRTQRDWDAVG
jgi:hypothetical protein